MNKIVKIYIAFLRLLANHCIIPQIRHGLFKLSGLNFRKKTFINMGLNIIDDYENLIEIGYNVALSPNVTFVANSNPNHSVLAQNPKFIKKAKILVGDNSWIGAGAVIMPGIIIGKNCIIGSNAVVTKNVNDFEIVAGVPAKVIGKTN
jgi:acetyltransferase-like isoleucine patch superfamily enzyme